jgi:hypothetical protein
LSSHLDKPYLTAKPIKSPRAYRHNGNPSWHRKNSIKSASKSATKKPRGYQVTNEKSTHHGGKRQTSHDKKKGTVEENIKKAPAIPKVVKSVIVKAVRTSKSKSCVQSCKISAVARRELGNEVYNQKRRAEGQKTKSKGEPDQTKSIQHKTNSSRIND